MDPVTLAILFGSVALAGLGARHETQEAARTIRHLYEWNHYRATEILSPAALADVGQLMDMNLSSWWYEVDSGNYRVVLIAQVGGPISNHVVVLYERNGAYDWFVRAVYRHGYRRVNDRSDYQRIGELTRVLNQDPAAIVVDAAEAISNPTTRRTYLKDALMSGPRLSAVLSQDPHFQTIVEETVEAAPFPALPPPPVEAIEERFIIDDGAAIRQPGPVAVGQ